jgi:hypothetical protein
VAYLLDTNILLRSADPAHPMNAEAVEAVAADLDVAGFRLRIKIYLCKKMS